MVVISWKSDSFIEALNFLLEIYEPFSCNILVSEVSKSTFFLTRLPPSLHPFTHTKYGELFDYSLLEEWETQTLTEKVLYLFLASGFRTKSASFTTTTNITIITTSSIATAAAECECVGQEFCGLAAFTLTTFSFLFFSSAMHCM